MNEMKHFFNTTSVDTIGECLNGEKLLNASRNEKGNTLLTFESAYEGYSDLLTITPDGSVIGTFICDEEQQPQTVNDTQCAANEIVKMDDLIHYENSAEFHRAYADFLDAAELLAVDGQAVVTLAELARKCADAAQLNAYRLATRYPVMVRAALGLPDINYTPGFNPDVDLDTDSISSMLPNYMDTEEMLRAKQKHLLESVRSRKIKVNYHDSTTSFLEGVFAKGDRRLAPVIVEAYKRGCYFDGWEECFKYDTWLQTFADLGIDPAFYCQRPIGLDEVTPWSHMDYGVTHEYLVREYKKALAAQTTQPCNRACHGCGANHLLGGPCFDYSKNLV